MPDISKDEIQRQLLQELITQRRRSFKGPLALQLHLTTSKANPPHLHSIAKNLLDLFGKPRRSLKANRSALLYNDDAQIDALSVRCHHHGEGAPPIIRLIARPMRDVMEELRLVTAYDQQRYDDNRFQHELNRDRALERLFDSSSAQAVLRERFGDQAADDWLRMARIDAQEAMLSADALTPSDLWRAFTCADVEARFNFQGMWEKTFNLSPLRIKLDELPNEPGSSSTYRRNVAVAIKDFRERYRFLVAPLLFPVAVEVVVKPCHPKRRRGNHDLDNVVRDYLMPSVLEILKPLSHHSFAFENAAEHEDAEQQPFEQPPRSTRTGVTRYEIWRLPHAAEDEKGFVSLAIVADLGGFDGVFEKLNSAIKVWERTI